MEWILAQEVSGAPSSSPDPEASRSPSPSGAAPRRSRSRWASASHWLRRSRFAQPRLCPVVGRCAPLGHQKPLKPFRAPGFVAPHGRTRRGALRLCPFSRARPKGRLEGEQPCARTAMFMNGPRRRDHEALDLMSDRGLADAGSEMVRVRVCERALLGSSM